MISRWEFQWFVGLNIVSPYTKCNHVTNNMIESFNYWIKNFKAMPILRMLEEIRNKIIILIYRKQQQVLTWQDKLTLIVRRMIMIVREESSHCK